MQHTFALALILIANSAYARNTEAQDFMEWASKHGKDYKDQNEFKRREQQFAKTMSEVEALNRLDTLATFATNKFSDWYPEEI